jgi:hypothetical protein
LLKNKICGTSGKTPLEVQLEGTRKVAFLLLELSSDFFLTTVDQILVILSS